MKQIALNITKLMSRIFAATIILVTLVATLAQWHHHDCSGKMFLNFGVEEFALTEGGFAECHHNDCDHHGNHDCNDSECGMHLAASTPNHNIDNYVLSVDVVHSRAIALPQAHETVLKINTTILSNRPFRQIGLFPLEMRGSPCV